MTKKDYILLAKVFNIYSTAFKSNEEQALKHAGEYRVTGSALVREMVYKLAEKLAEENPRFDRQKFAIACGVE